MTEQSFATTWSTSSGTRNFGSERKNAALELHRKHFVEQRGMAAFEETAEARRKEAQKNDKRMELEHRRRLKALSDDSDEKFKNSMKFGSTTMWTREERDRIEDLRIDPDEAYEKMKLHTKQVARNYRQERGAMTERVWSKPSMNVRSKEEQALIEEARQDPQEASTKMTKHIKDLGQRYRDEKAAMTARVNARPRSTFWTKEQRAKLGEPLKDPDEVQEEQRKNLKGLTRGWQEEIKSMNGRVKKMEAMSLRSPAELAAIEDFRQDPEEAKAKMLKHLSELERAAREKKAAMLERVEKSPRKTFWTPEEREVIEELRTDPEEAKQRATKDMKELAQRYREQKSEMLERVDAISRKTLEDPEVNRQRRYAAELRLKQLPQSTRSREAS